MTSDTRSILAELVAKMRAQHLLHDERPLILEDPFALRLLSPQMAEDARKSGFQSTIEILNRIGEGEIEVVTIENKGTITPLAEMVVNGMSMKADIVPPDKITRIIVESAKARILNETRTLACMHKKDYVITQRVKDLPEKIECPRCGSTEIGIFERNEDEVYQELGKERPGRKRTGERWWQKGKDASKLVSIYGKRGAIVAAAKRVNFTDAWDLLAETEGESEEFFERIVEAERNALKRGFN